MMRLFSGRWGHAVALVLVVVLMVVLGLISYLDIAHKRHMSAMASRLNISPLLLPVHVPDRLERLADQTESVPADSATSTDNDFGAYAPEQMTRSWVPNRP